MYPLIARAVTLREPYLSTPDSVLVSSNAILGTSDTSDSYATAYASGSYESSEVAYIIEKYFGANHIMYWVALNESTLDPSAYNPSGAQGLFQIVGITWRHFKCEGDPFNAVDNTLCAKKIYEKNGLRDWEWSRNHGSDGGWGKRLWDAKAAYASAASTP